MGNEDKGSLLYTTSRRLFLDNEALQKGKLLEFLDAMDFEVLVWGSDLYGLEQNTKSTSEQSCLIKGRDEFYGRYGFDIPSIMNVSMFLKKDMCRDRNYRGTRKQVLAKSLNFPVYESFNNSNAMKCIRYHEPLIATEDAAELDDDDPKEIIQEKIDQQSQRLAFRMFHYRFKDLDVPDLDFEEWRFLKTGLGIFKAACPPEMVSDFFLSKIVAMFQFMLQESFLLFAPIVDQDSKVIFRIRNALDRCKANATRMDFTNTAVCSKDVRVWRVTIINLNLFSINPIFFYTQTDPTSPNLFKEEPNINFY